MSEERKPNYVQGLVLLVCGIAIILALLLWGWDWIVDLL
jgi:hypothetical protein